MSIQTPRWDPNNNHQNHSGSQNISHSIGQKLHQNLSLTLIPLTSIEKQKILERADETTKNILTKKSELAPTHQVRIDGIDFYFWPKIKYEEKILFFVDNNGRIEPRVSRISGSGQKMHIFPGYDAKIISTPKWKYPTNKRYSKGDMAWKMDYESGVIADPRIEKILQNLPNETNPIRNFWDFLAIEWYLSENYETKESLKEFEKINIGKVLNTYDNTASLANIGSSFESWNQENQKKFYAEPHRGMKNIFNWLGLDEKIFQKFIENNYEFPKWSKYQKISSENDTVQKWNIEAGEWNGTMLYVTICYDKKDRELCWVESFNIFGSPITSFGIQKHRISGGLFTAKPAEYFSQIPKFLQEDMKQKNPDMDFYSDATYDIREYLQENPFIIAFKKLRENHKEFFV